MIQVAAGIGQWQPLFPNEQVLAIHKYCSK